MAKMNVFVSLTAYADPTSTNSPSLNVFKWARDTSGLTVDNPTSEQLSLAPGETRTLFNGSRSLTQDNTTQYTLALKPANSSIYTLKYVSGAAPGFRAGRISGADASTTITVTQNGSTFTFTSTSGTPFSLLSNGVTVGDQVIIGAGFSLINQGTFKILARTATSFTIQNSDGAPEMVSLNSSFADQVRIFSSSGVQVGDILNIFGTFSPASQGAYQVTGVQDNLVEFSSTKALPTETQTTNQIAVYTQAKRIVYIEADQKSTLVPNSGNGIAIEPIQDVSGKKPGVLMRSAITWSLSITNDSLDMANYYVASAE